MARVKPAETIIPKPSEENASLPVITSIILVIKNSTTHPIKIVKLLVSFMFISISEMFPEVCFKKYLLTYSCSICELGDSLITMALTV